MLTSRDGQAIKTLLLVRTSLPIVPAINVLIYSERNLPILYAVPLLVVCFAAYLLARQREETARLHEAQIQAWVEAEREPFLQRWSKRLSWRFACDLRARSVPRRHWRKRRKLGRSVKPQSAVAEALPSELGRGSRFSFSLPLAGGAR